MQFLLARQIQPFRTLRDRYSIQPILAPEVEIELRSHRRLAQRIAPELRRALQASFRRSSFINGLSQFTPRLTDLKARDVGMRDPMASGFAKTIVL